MSHHLAILSWNLFNLFVYSLFTLLLFYMLVRCRLFVILFMAIHYQWFVPLSVMKKILCKLHQRLFAILRLQLPSSGQARRRGTIQLLTRTESGLKRVTISQNDSYTKALCWTCVVVIKGQNENEQEREREGERRTGDINRRCPCIVLKNLFFSLN